MTARLVLPALALLAGAPQPASLPAAERLVQAVLDARNTSGFRARARLTRITGGVTVSRALLITGRRDGARTSVVYRVTGPADKAGHALLLEDDGTHRVSGARIDRTSIAPITGSMLGDPVFDSDLRIEDLFEGFWFWPSPIVTGEERVGNRRSAIVEFRPPPGTLTSYGRVKVWIAIDIALPMRIELFDRAGFRVARITAGRIVKRDGRWAAARRAVERSGSASRTLIEGSSFDPDLDLPASDFTTAAVARAVRKRE